MAVLWFRKHRSKGLVALRFVTGVVFTVLGFALFVFVHHNVSTKLDDLLFVHRNVNTKLDDHSAFNLVSTRRVESIGNFSYSQFRRYGLKLPKQNDLSVMLDRQNQLPPINMDLYPKLGNDHLVIVLYVHNRPKYLKVVIDSLSRVEGINETLLIVSHDGFYEKMNKQVQNIRFCQVKQIFAPFSPHLFANSFPGTSPSDCKDKDDAAKKRCKGTKDQYGNHRSPRIVALKHHWWWMMNTVWDGLKETYHHTGHILFIEEDHFIMPNAYRNLQLLARIKPVKCPNCYALNLAPTEVYSRGEDDWNCLVTEKMGNVGYSFDRTVWREIHQKANEYCSFDDYNWDITMWTKVYPPFSAYTLRGPRSSAIHFGKCGLHQGQEDKAACVVDGGVNITIEETDKVMNIDPNWGVRLLETQHGYKSSFKGWGGWGDIRDRKLCLDFAKMYGH